jgi:predicted alpha/beta superfamily hydrolase
MHKLLLASLLTPFLSFGQKTIEINFPSKNLSDSRKIWIALPKYYDLRKDSFHVVYLFDGDNQSLFNLSVSAKRFLEGNAADLNEFNAPASIIVGIEQKDRGKDFVDSAANFLKFLSDELMPYVKKKYRTLPYSVLIGHSLGGRFALYSFLSRPDLFNAIITASPAYTVKSVTKTEQKLDSLLSNADLKDRAWFLSTSYAENDNTEAQFRGFAEEIKNYYQQKAIPNFRFSFDSSSSLGHAKTPFFTIPEGLHFIYDPFKWYLSPVTRTQIFQNKLPALSALEQYQKNIENIFGVSIRYDRWAGFIVYSMIKDGREEEAISFLKKAIQINPTDLDLFIQLLKLLKETNDKELNMYSKQFDNILTRMRLTKEQIVNWQATLK